MPGVIAFGSTWRKATERFVSPPARAASTKVRSRSDSTSAADQAQVDRDVEHRDDDHDVHVASAGQDDEDHASTNSGNACTVSEVRMTSSPAHPRKKLVSNPMREPTTSENERRDQRDRHVDARSGEDPGEDVRPDASVPKQCDQLGAWSAVRTPCRRVFGTMIGPKMARNTAMATAPARSSAAALARRSAEEVLAHRCRAGDRPSTVPLGSGWPARARALPGHGWLPSAQRLRIGPEGRESRRHVNTGRSSSENASSR